MTGDIVVGVRFKPPDQEDHVYKALYRQLGAVLCSEDLILMGHFN